jgi:hypothetical protein
MPGSFDKSPMDPSWVPGGRTQTKMGGPVRAKPIPPTRSLRYAPLNGRRHGFCPATPDNRSLCASPVPCGGVHRGRFRKSSGIRFCGAAGVGKALASGFGTQVV